MRSVVGVASFAAYTMFQRHMRVRMFHPKQLVLIPIDMQEAFDLPGRPRGWNADLDQNGLALLAAWRGSRA